MVASVRFLFFTVCFVVGVFSAVAQEEGRCVKAERVLGNWVREGDGVWCVGFWEKFAIYRNDFWDYRRFEWRGNRGRVVLGRGREEAELRLEVRGDSVMVVSEGRDGKAVCRLWDGRCPKFATRDTSMFRDYGYAPDTVTVRGYYRDYEWEEGEDELMVFNIFKRDYEGGGMKVDSLGRFEVKLPVRNTTYVVGVGIVEPGDCCFMFVGGDEERFLYMGDHARLLNELAGSPLAFFGAPEVRESDDLLFLKGVRAWHGRQLDRLEAYRRGHPMVSDRLFCFFREMAGRELMSVLGQRQYFLKRGAFFPPEYVAYWKSCLEGVGRPWSLLPENSFSLWDYISYAGQGQGQGLLFDSLVKECRVWEASGRLVVSNEEWAMVGRVDSCVRMGMTVDGVLQGRLKVFMGRGDVGEVVRTLDVRDLVRNLFTDRRLGELAAGMIYYRILKDDCRPLNWRMLSNFMEAVEDPALREAVLDVHQLYSRLEKEEVAFAGSLRDGTAFGGVTDADSLWSELTRPFRGKVVYVDVWGTWCGPCKEQMAYAGKVKRALAGKDVVFLYLANGSPEQAWRNVIKEYGLTGAACVHYNLPDHQQALLEGLLGVEAFPAFLLMDRKGRVVSRNAPKPEDGDVLFKQIELLLKGE